MSSETSRVEAFSDGVYAVAITLLIFNIHVPPSDSAGHLGAALVAQWPAYVAFLISFAFIGIMWVNHHRLFNHIRRSDNWLLFLNLLLLLGVTTVPFPTALLATHYNAADRTIATAVFNGTYFAIAIFFNVLWHHAVRAGLLDSQTLESADAISKQYAVGPAAYLLCFILTWISAPASLLLNIALAVFFALPPREAIRKNHNLMRSATK
jgi:uncharacterized membrane protein